MRIVGSFPEREPNTQSNRDDKERKNTDYFEGPPSDLVHIPLGALVE
jgi:hypothetical protein